MAKILIIAGCEGCPFRAFMLGTYRCIQPYMPDRTPTYSPKFDDSCKYQIVPIGVDAIHENCPLPDYVAVVA